MTRIPEQGRLPVQDSLSERLRAGRPDLQVRCVATSTLVASGAGTGRLDLRGQGPRTDRASTCRALGQPLGRA